MRAHPRRGAVARPRGPDPIPLRDQKKLRKKYYAGERLPSPMGGALEPIAVRHGGSEPGTVLFECMTSSLRFALSIPKATTAERKVVREAIEAGTDPTCPRHGPHERLVRTGTSWSCSKCGVSFGRAG